MVSPEPGSDRSVHFDQITGARMSDTVGQPVQYAQTDAKSLKCTFALWDGTGLTADMLGADGLTPESKRPRSFQGTRPK